jgi:hypothetical protein
MNVIDGREPGPEQGCAEREVVIDGHEYRVRRRAISAVELLDLVSRSPEEWSLVAELEGGDRVVLGGDSEVELHEDRIAIFHTEKRELRHHQEECMLTVVANTIPVRVEVQPVTLLSAVIAEALKKSGAKGQEGKVWVLKTMEGTVLDQSATVDGAHIECGSTLFLSLEIGAAGDGGMELLVDRTVTREKFDAQIAGYLANQDLWNIRGVWLAKSEFPQAFFVFGASNSTPPFQLLAFGAIFDFSNYDLWAPSVCIVNPFTKVPYRAKELPFWAQLPQLNGEFGPNGQPMGERLMQWQSDDEIPFLCHPGVREYHQHPAHDGNDWLLHRTSGEGTLDRLLQILFDRGASRLAGLQFQLTPAMKLNQ